MGSSCLEFPRTAASCLWNHELPQGSVIRIAKGRIGERTLLGIRKRKEKKDSLLILCICAEPLFSLLRAAPRFIRWPRVASGYLELSPAASSFLGQQRVASGTMTCLK